jgi:predicted DNA-binding antitoxin AbrB/MazE fold protein
MIQTLNAVFDGEVFQPDLPLKLKAGTRVRIIVESVLLPDEKERPKTFLQTAKSLQLQGEPDWSENIDRYLYGDRIIDND